MRRIVLPKKNKRDIEADLPEHVKKSLLITYVTTLEDVLSAAFADEPDNVQNAQVDLKSRL